jgi:nicotinate-nucleotide adenylyltransferase
MSPVRTMLFGGSFDPPHRGHAQVADAVLREGLADEVWFVPCGAHPFGRELSAPKHRVAMVELILRPNVSVCTFEADKAMPSYSIETLEHLSRLHPQRAFAWLMGSDLLPSFDEWHQFDKLLARWPVYVYPRRGHPFDPLYAGMTALRSLPEIDVSSTAVRRRLAEGTSITDLVEPEVETYITTHGLYRPQHAATL